MSPCETSIIVEENTRRDPLSFVAGFDTFREDREEALHDRAPLFRVELLGKFHRALYVGEEHRYLLALAFEGGLGLQNFVGQVLRGARYEFYSWRTA